MEEQALFFLGQIESWIRHSDEYQRFFDVDEDITDEKALNLIAYITDCVMKHEGTKTQ